jgi:hypothetical protein
MSSGRPPPAQKPRQVKSTPPTANTPSSALDNAGRDSKREANDTDDNNVTAPSEPTVFSPELVDVWWKSHRLESKFRALAEDLREALATKNHQHEKSKKQVVAWRGDVKQFADSVSTQLEYCRTLRESGTMQAMLEESSERALRKRTTRIIDQLRADLVLMQQSQIMQEALARRDPDWKHEFTDVDSIHSFQVFEQRSEWEVSTSHLVERLRRVREQVDLNSSASATATADATSPNTMEVIFDLIDLHRDTQTFLCSKVCNRCKSVGSISRNTQFATDLQEAQNEERGNNQQPRKRSHLAQIAFLKATRATQNLLHVLKASDELVSQAIVREEYEDDDVGLNIATFCAANKESNRLKRELKGAEQEIALLTNALETAKSNDDVKISARHRMQFDETTLKMTRMEREYKTMCEQQSEMKLNQQVLLSQTRQLREELVDLKNAHAVETQFYAPRIQELHEMVQRTAGGLDAISLDVELISRMYESICATSNQHDVQLSCVKAERTQLETKLRTAIKRIQECKRELSRKDKIIATVMASREECIGQLRKSELHVQQLSKELASEKESRIKAEEDRKCCAVRLDECKLEAAENAASAQRFQQDLMSLRAEVKKTRVSFNGGKSSVVMPEGLSIEMLKTKRKLKEVRLAKEAVEFALNRSEERNRELKGQVNQLREVIVAASENK